MLPSESILLCGNISSCQLLMCISNLLSFSLLPSLVLICQCILKILFLEYLLCARQRSMHLGLTSKQNLNKDAGPDVIHILMGEDKKIQRREIIEYVKSAME